MLKKYRYVGLMVFFALWITACSDKTNEENKQILQNKEQAQLESQLKNIEECYLCGNSDKSMMSYYRQFDTIGLIALNEWIVLDFRLDMEDSSEGTNSVYGNSQGINYQVDAVPSRGMSHMKVESNEKFDSDVIKNNLCQNCLDKVSKCVSIEQPFVLIDFKTQNLYSLKEAQQGFFIRDYWIEIKHNEKVKISVYYLPKKINWKSTYLK